MTIEFDERGYRLPVGPCIRCGRQMRLTHYRRVNGEIVCLRCVGAEAERDREVQRLAEHNKMMTE